MKNTDKVTLTLGQLKTISCWSHVLFWRRGKDWENRTESFKQNRRDEYRNGYFETALDLIIDYRRNHRPYFKSDFNYWEKRCRDKLI